MKALHYQTQKEQNSLEERLAQEEVPLPLKLTVHSIANFRVAVNLIMKTRLNAKLFI